MHGIPSVLEQNPDSLATLDDFDTRNLTSFNRFSLPVEFMLVVE
jgi:hypothetical protein